MFCLLSVDEVEPLGFDLPVDESTSESSEEFLGEGVVLRLTVLGDVILVLFSSVECTGTGHKFVSDLGLAFTVVLVVKLSLFGVFVEPAHDDKSKEMRRGG